MVGGLGPVGGQQDDHGCMLGAGYQWCDTHQACERPWLSPCPITDGCGCEHDQGLGWSESHGCCMVGAITTESDTNNCQSAYGNLCPDVVVDPMPPPYPMPYPAVPMPSLCPEVMCMMYCPNGVLIDENGCSMCQCQDSVHPIDLLTPGPEPAPEPVQDMNSQTIPEGCLTWYDGCNVCEVSDDGLLACTMMMCFQNGESECRAYRAYGIESGH